MSNKNIIKLSGFPFQASANEKKFIVKEGDE